MKTAIVFAADLPECSGCGEPYCDRHGRHYYECDCLGPAEAADLEAQGLGSVSEDGMSFEWPGDESLDDLRARMK